MLMVSSGIGEKVFVMKNVDKCNHAFVKGFFDALPSDIQEKVIVVGLANYLMQTSNDEFVEKVRKNIFPECEVNEFIRYK